MAAGLTAVELHPGDVVRSAWHKGQVWRVRKHDKAQAAVVLEEISSSYRHDGIGPIMWLSDRDFDAREFEPVDC